MNKSLGLLLFKLVLLSFLLLLLTRGAAFAAEVITNNFPVQIVTCEDGVDVDALLKEHGVTPRHRYRHALNGFAAPLPPGIVEKLKHDKRVIAVEQDGTVKTCNQTVPTGITRIGADTFPIGRSNGVAIPIDVGVAILDSGIDPHPDLNIYTNYWTFSSDGSDSLGGSTNDPYGHGTCVAGVLAAQDNGYGVVGVAPGVKIWNVKCTGPAPYNTFSQLIAGMDYVTANATNGIAVANISIVNSGSGAPYTALRSAIGRMVGGGVVVVAAAGNDAHDMAGPDGKFGTGDDALPASHPLSMAVSAMDPTTDTIASFSNFGQISHTNNPSSAPANMVLSSGQTIDVAAPGVNILTTGVGSNYVTVSGTSFAAPHVAGLVALYIAANGRATNCWGVFKIRQAIVDNSLPQSQWRTNNTGDPDSHPEPLAMASLNWAPTTLPIASQPASQAINSGNSVTFGVAAVGSSFTYQWSFNGSNLSDNNRITGSTASTLTITNVASGDAGNYQVIATDTASNTTTSAAAMLTVLPPSLVLNGSFEAPDYLGVWLVESTDSSVYVLLNEHVIQFQFPAAGLDNYDRPTPAGNALLSLNYYGGASVLRQDMATPLSAGTNYNLSFLQSGSIDFHAPAQITVSIAPTGFTNEVYAQTFNVSINADWTRQQASFTVPSNGLYSLRLKSIPGTVALVDDVNLWPAPAVVTVTPPVFQNISQSGNAINLTWSAVAGQAHQLQYKTNLNQPTWLNLGTAITATGTTLSVTNNLNTDPQRFYRVMVGQ